MLPSRRLEFQAKIDQQPVEDLFGVGAGGLFGNLWAADGCQMRAVLLGQIGGNVWPVTVEEFAVVTDWLAGFRRLPDVVTDRYSSFGERNDRFIERLPEPTQLMAASGIRYLAQRPSPSMMRRFLVTRCLRRYWRVRCGMGVARARIISGADTPLA